jgi:hypothetical protein
MINDHGGGDAVKHGAKDHLMVTEKCACIDRCALNKGHLRLFYQRENHAVALHNFKIGNLKD